MGALKTDPLISIIMPAYNSEKYILDSINSIIEQTYESWELIIVDDCSKDSTLSIINKYSEKYNQIHVYVNSNNEGVSASRNKGISNANGDWIAFLDSDDLWEKTKLQKQVKYAIDNEQDFIFTGASYINESGHPYDGIFEVPEIITYELLKLQNVISCSSVLIKKEYFNEIKMERDDIHEDYAVWLKILKKGTKAFGINEPLLIYRISSSSKSGNKIKTIKMTYKVFRFIGINPVGSLYYMVRHVLGALKKYKKILRQAHL
ncbi:glycosyltransferase family 2 protein [Rossellomorea marisflavi]|uniref:glycosyltransferase family 2 protein n=1 Tax=Rossellomorea marisflavi TaxID=189381 RepID=UPI0009A8CDB8|nr:glycosyltransferase family 2 protein [Rossellomorea marisflavi]